jgi:2'-5' RNA ligase
MRLFAAIDLPPEIRERLDQLIGKLRSLARIGWSQAANLHITTKFIGEWPEERLPELRQSLAALRYRTAIPIRIGGLGFFPNPRAPHVFWAGVEAAPELTALAAETDLAVAALGVKKEPRAYSPHLTLARIKGPEALHTFRAEVQRLSRPEFGSFDADRFYLYLSKPGQGGSVYTKLSEFPFTTS